MARAPDPNLDLLIRVAEALGGLRSRFVFVGGCATGLLITDPALRYPPLRVVRYTGAALTEGAESHQVEGREVRVYNVAKTLADCFKYRNKIGLDVALEALREAWRGRRFKMDELDRYAAICRVQRVMRPYLEALAA